MKKLFVLFFALSFAFVMTAKAQSVELDIDDVVVPAGTVLVPVTLVGTFTDVCSFDMDIEFDDNLLTFVGATNVVAGSATTNGTANAGSGTSPLSVNWSVNSNGYSTPIKILDLEFIYTGGGNSDLIVTGTYTVGGGADCLDDLSVYATIQNGSITEAPAVPVSNWAIIIGIAMMVVVLAVSFRKFF